MKNSTLNLMYHDIILNDVHESGFTNPTAIKYKIFAKDFEQQVKMCTDNNVVFTFDDGGSSFINYAAPILEKYGKRGIFFISTQYINTDGFLTTDEIEKLASHGHIIGSHSHTHPQNISTLPRENLIQEWLLSTKQLESIIGDKISYASIPNGFSNEDVCLAAAECGIKYIYTSQPTTSIKYVNKTIIYGRYVITNYTSIRQFYLVINSYTYRFILLLVDYAKYACKHILGNKYLRIRQFLKI